MKKKNLVDLRKEINGIDREIIGLLGRRGAISSSIGEIKKLKNEPVYSPDREIAIYRRLKELNKGPLSNEAIKSVYSEIMSGCLALERPLIVAFLGPELTFTHQVSTRKFGSSVDYLDCNSISDVFSEVEKGHADYGVVPVENSIEGAVSHTMDMFANSSLMICSEAYLRIRHSVLSKSKNLKTIDRIYSNPQVFGQCRKWLEKNIPLVKLRDTLSTAKAAEITAKHKTSACIASEIAAKKYKLNILARSIEDSSENVTRFLVIGKNMAKPSGNDKTSIMISVKDRPGVLHGILSSFKRRGINLTKIESRPSKIKAWKYYFFIDMEGHYDESGVRKALAELERKSIFLKILGSYPRGE